MRQADVAVIGGGLAGLAAAWALGQEHRVTLYEAHRETGFTAASLSVPVDERGDGLRVDVPLRVFYPGYYPTLLALYAEIGAATEPVSYATSFFGRDGRRLFRYRNVSVGDRSLAVVSPWQLLRSPSREVAFGAWQFSRELRRARSRGELQGLTLEGFLARCRAPSSFVQTLLLPMVCTVATCSSEQALAYPAEVVADYLLRGVTQEAVRRATLGADDVARRLLQRVSHAHFSADVRSLESDATGVTLRHGEGHSTRHEHVVLATSARQALRLLHDAAAAERTCLARVEHTPVEVVVHRDPAVMPRYRQDWSPVNAGVWPGQSQAMATIWVNRVQPALRAASPVFQTVAPAVPLQPSLVLGHARFERPLVTLSSMRVPEELSALHRQPGRRLWFCGSYACDGVPLLESAVRSAQSAAKALLAELARSVPLHRL